MFGDAVINMVKIPAGHGPLKPFGNYAARHDRTHIGPGWRVDHLLLDGVPNGFTDARPTAGLSQVGVALKELPTSGGRHHDQASRTTAHPTATVGPAASTQHAVRTARNSRRHTVDHGLA